MSKIVFIFALGLALLPMKNAHSKNIKVATFNVSMEALNYIEHKRGSNSIVPSNTLTKALQQNNAQIKNIAEIIQRVNPDIILLNEFDFSDNNLQSKHSALKDFLDNYLAKSQQGQAPQKYPYFYQGPVNTGVNSGFDLDGNGIKGQLPGDGFGFGYFPGHFAMAILSKYPIDIKNIRTFQHFKWADMPNALQPIDEKTNQSWFKDNAWSSLRLSSKSHWDVPITVNNKTLHILASHPTPPVFDGPEDRNGKRNHDEIRFWHDYISDNNNGYIYDDNGQKGGLTQSSPFIILGDLNASNVDGDAINTGIDALLNHDKINDVMPSSDGGKKHSKNNTNAQHHTAYWRMRADYVLPSKQGFKYVNSGVFWPLENEPTFRLIKDRTASSDHRLVWVELELTN
ncbi:endonuclease/exonuclease/phosphatase family protein [Litorilituus lipolyticus]|uniref:Endonuclease/exonuclease/phosphatase family protein n=1 Tax=Litorilituus lipolyticus TaxID=2491017 RepID=A0A502L7Y2_9GAMM|nr:endonuclease/exonuclease/phosphatase family protein [Litorilituus lipolyticus]TPH16487.1 endonuclease/exonuclease/phosphatase family protein [Litorilituus lipolyticus]